MIRPACIAASIALLFGSGCQRDTDALPFGDSRGNCAGCHQEQADAFERSAHAHSAESPVFQALLPEVGAAWGEAARARCESCHAPGHAQAGLDPDEGVTCISCHTAVGNRAERDGRLVLDTSLGVAGPFADPEAGAAHATRPSTFLASPSLCGTCHEVTGPELFVEPTWTEHQLSPAFAAGEHCMDCHMPQLEDAPAGGLRDRARRDHSFIGVDPPWGADEESRVRATEATRALLRAALRLEASSDGGALSIAVENRSRAHSVPTGISMLRGLWVHVRWLDAEGIELGEVIALELNDQPMSGDMDVALPTSAERIDVRRLGASETRGVRLDPPSSAHSAHVSVRFRAFRQDVLESLGLADRGSEVPTIVVEEANVPLP